MKILRSLVLMFIVFTMLSACNAFLPPVITDIVYMPETEEASVSFNVIGNDHYMFLPSSADLSALVFVFKGESVTLSVGNQSIGINSGEPFDLLSLYDKEPNDGIYAFVLSRGAERLPVKLMISENIASMYITSSDLKNGGRAYVESDKENKATGKMTFLDPDGTVVYNGKLKQIKGRGNSTWDYPKKPYQIKLDKAFDLIGTGDDSEAKKTWVLLANYADESFVRNSLTYDLAAELSLPYTPNTRPVDLYYDGEYLGIYLLCEKTEIGAGRVDIHDLEEDIENANPNVNDLDLLPTEKGKSSYGNEYQYVAGLNDPKDLSGGYLLEIDYPHRALEEKSYFITSHDSYVVSKSPEYLSQRAMEYISSFYQEFEDAVYAGGVNPDTGKSYTDYIDLRSLAKSYLISEFSQEGDTFRSSSYFYKPENEDRLYAGPVWDFDSAYGLFFEIDDITEMTALRTSLGKKLLEIPSFCEAVEDIYKNEIYPLVTDVLLSEDKEAQHGRLRSFDAYIKEISAANKMDDIRWSKTETEDFDYAVDQLSYFISQRSKLLYDLSWQDVSKTLIFVDVPPKEVYFDAVNYVANKGFIDEVKVDYFDPMLRVTRAVAVTALYRMTGGPDAGTPPFDDVSQKQWFAEAAAWANEAGIFQDETSKNFRPDDNITRQELASMLYQYAKLVGCDVSSPPLPEEFTDRDSIAPWAVDAFSWAVHRGIINGISESKLDPKGDVRRYALALIIQRYDKIVKS